MRRQLVLTFDVVDASISDEQLYEMSEEIVKWIAPDPPVLVYDGAEVTRSKG